jgi:heme exporter protein B
MTEPPGTLRAAVLLAGKDLLLEARSPELVAGVGLFSLAALVALHFAVAGDGRQVSGGLAGGVLWVVIILGATLALSRAFSAERDAGIIDALLLTPVSRNAIWLSKALALGAMLVLVELVVVPLHWLFFYTAASNSPPLWALVSGLALADLGLASVGALVAALASPARLREVLLPVLFLPIATPALIVGIEVTKNAAEGGPVARYLALLALYDAIFAVIAWGTTEFVLTD